MLQCTQPVQQVQDYGDTIQIYPDFAPHPFDPPQAEDCRSVEDHFLPRHLNRIE